MIMISHAPVTSVAVLGRARLATYAFTTMQAVVIDVLLSVLDNPVIVRHLDYTSELDICCLLMN